MTIPLRNIFAAAALSLPLLSSAQSQPPQAKVSINAATVFLSGAELTSTVRVNVPAGESDVLLTNIAGNVNQQSLVIGADNGIIIQSATFQNNYLADSALSPRAQKLRDSLAALELQIGSSTDRKQVLDEQLTLIRENRRVAGANSGLSVAELTKMLDLVNVRMNALLTEQRQLAAKTEKTHQRINNLKQQLDEEQRKGYQPGGQLLVKFYAKQGGAANVNLSYVVPNAGWSPAYDLRVDKVNDPVKLFYKANVYQNSGVKWDNVKLSLSTGNPNEGVEAPVLSPWYLAYYVPQSLEYQSRTNSISLNRAYKEPMQMAKSSGYLSAPIAEVADRDESGVSNHTTVDNAGINTTFDIDLPYSFPSDGQQHTVAIREHELPATYRYFAVPKLDKDAFLQAQITKWEDLNLLPATTNVFFEGSYVGQGYIDMRNVRDTMNLSLGRDKKIIIRRERDMTYQREKTIGTNERQSYAWNISVRNTRKESIRLVVLDQLPVSNDDDIVIENPKWGEANRDLLTGALRWTMDVKPAEMKKVNYSYTVKYPRGKSIANLR